MDRNAQFEYVNAQATAFLKGRRPVISVDTRWRQLVGDSRNGGRQRRPAMGRSTSDKVHAARRRGKWTGGPPPLGYDVAPEGGRTVVNEAEAERRWRA